MKSTRLVRRIAGCLGVACILWIDGCRPHVPTGTVSGKVIASGQLLTCGMVVFKNVRSGLGAAATLDDAGNYNLTTPIPTGSYEVAIQPPPFPPPDRMPAALPKWTVAEKFRDPSTSGLKATIRVGANTADFEL